MRLALIQSRRHAGANDRYNSLCVAARRRALAKSDSEVNGPKPG